MTGNEWKSTQDMLSQVFTALNDDSVRHFLVRTPPQVDVEIITSPGRLAKGVSHTSMARVLNTSQCNSESDTLSVELVIPMHTVDDLAFGISIESLVPTEAALETFRSSDHLFHFVHNVRSDFSIAIALNEENGFALVRYQNQKRLAVLLHFDLIPFLNAFINGIDVDELMRALSWSSVSRICSNPGNYPRLLPAFTGSVLLGHSLPPSYRQCSLDDVVIRGICSSYNDGRKTQSKNVGVMICSNAGTHDGAVNSLTNWAVAHRMSFLSPAPKLPISTLDHHVAILPAPSPEMHTSATFAEKIDRFRAERKERRKITNRIAAAKSNAKRSEMRARRRAARNNTQQTT